MNNITKLEIGSDILKNQSIAKNKKTICFDGFECDEVGVVGEVGKESFMDCLANILHTPNEDKKIEEIAGILFQSQQGIAKDEILVLTDEEVEIEKIARGFNYVHQSYEHGISFQKSVEYSTADILIDNLSQERVIEDFQIVDEERTEKLDTAFNLQEFEENPETVINDFALNRIKNQSETRRTDVDKYHDLISSDNQLKGTDNKLDFDLSNFNNKDITSARETGDEISIKIKEENQVEYDTKIEEETNNTADKIPLRGGISVFSGRENYINTVQKKSIVSQVTNTIKDMVTEERQVLVLELSPKGMGDIKINLSSKDNILELKLHADSELVAKAVAEDITTLRAVLLEEGFENVNIEVGNGLDFGLSDTNHNNQNNFQDNLRNRNIVSDRFDQTKTRITQKNVNPVIERRSFGILDYII